MQTTERELPIAPIKTMGLFSVPRLPCWSFQQLIHGGVLPPPAFPSTGPSILLRAMSKVEWLRAAVSPTDKIRKDSTQRLGRARRGPPVTAKKPIVFFQDDGSCHVLQSSEKGLRSSRPLLGPARLSAAVSAWGVVM
jgi:hypothetical protein